MPIIRLRRLNKKQKQERLENLGKDGKKLADLLYSVFSKFAKNQTNYAVTSFLYGLPNVVEILKRNHYDTTDIENISMEQVLGNFENLINRDEVPDDLKEKFKDLTEALL